MQKQYPLLRKVLPLIHLVHYIQKNGLLTSISDSMYLAFESEKKCALSSHVNAADIGMYRNFEFGEKPSHQISIR